MKASPKLITKKATDVHFGRLKEGERPVFKTIRFSLSNEIKAKVFKSKKDSDPNLLWNILKDLYKDECKQAKVAKKVPKPQQPKTWEQQVNEKRQLIASCLQRQTSLNFTEVSRFTGCDYSTVKRVYHDLMFSGQVSEFSYPHSKPPEVLQQFHESVSHLQGSFQTIADLKRLNPTCSRKWIRRGIRQVGFRYRKMRRELKTEGPPKPPPNKVFEVIDHLTQAIVSNSTEVCFADEMHYPLFQTADKRWTTLDQLDGMVYNRRENAQVKLSVVAICNLHGFVAVQVFIADLNSADFLYPIQRLLEQYNTGQKVTVLVDNATYHKSKEILESKPGKFLFYNVPGLFRLNMIENAFSFIRSEYRKRPLVATIEEEAANLINIFFHPDNAKRFEGIRRNHIRQLMLMLQENSPQLAKIKPQLDQF